MKRIHAAIAVLTLLAAATTLGAQNSADERIRRIENGLLPPVLIKGQPIRTLKLEDRMRELNIPGVERRRVRERPHRVDARVGDGGRRGGTAG